jgi:mRNA interferase MazF
MNPNRGEVWLVDLGYAAKVRPCLVVSISAEDEDNAHSAHDEFEKFTI